MNSTGPFFDSSFSPSCSWRAVKIEGRSSGFDAGSRPSRTPRPGMPPSLALRRILQREIVMVSRQRHGKPQNYSQADRVTNDWRVSWACLLLHGFHVGGYVVEIRSNNRDRLHLAFAFGDDLFNIGFAHALNRGVGQWLYIDFQYFGHAWIALAIGAVARLALRAVSRLPG